jgi:hypothetical protein
MVSPFNLAWNLLKALPEQQLMTESTGDIGPVIDETSRRLGTTHPAIRGILERQGRGGPEGFSAPNLQSLDYMGKPTKNTDIGNQPFHASGEANWRYPPRDVHAFGEDASGHEYGPGAKYPSDWKEKRARTRQKHILRDYGNPKYDPDEADWLDTEDESKRIKGIGQFMEGEVYR